MGSNFFKPHISDWVSTVIQQVRFAPDRKAIEQELTVVVLTVFLAIREHQSPAWPSPWQRTIEELAYPVPPASAAHRDVPGGTVVSPLQPGGDTMRLSRSGKCLRNLLLSLLLGFLLAAWLQFPPLTVGGMCRQMGRELLITTPEPIYVVKGDDPWLANFKNTYVIARSGDSYMTFLYKRPSLGVYRRSDLYRTTVSNDPTLTYYAGRLYLVGPLPEGTVSARAEATVQRTDVCQNADGSYAEPEYGETRVFPLNGELTAEGVLSFLVQELPFGPFDTSGSFTLRDAARKWYRILRESGNVTLTSTLYAEIPVQISLLDASGAVLDTLDLSIDTGAFSLC